MGIYSNSPTMTWISLTGISVAKGDEVFIVKDFKTNLKYIYWDYTNPYVFTATNVIKDRNTNLFQVAINDKGSFIEVPQEDIIVSYDGNSEQALSEHVWGLHEKADEFTNKFVSVEQNIDGITTTVGEHTEQMGLLEENISKVDQKADSINLSVQETKKEFNDNKDMMNLRENVNLSIINLNSALGVYKSLLNDYFKDSIISADEKVQIQANNDILTEKKNIMLSEMDKVIALMQEQENQTNVDTINRDKQLLETSITNLINLINTSISDNTIVPSEITTVINAFAKSNLDINDIKNSLDNMIFLGIGGKLSEEVASIDIKSDKIVSKVESVEKTVTSQGESISKHSSSISQMAGEIEMKVSAGDIASSINQTAQSVRIKASKIDLDGYATFTNLETEGQTNIHGGNIKTGTIYVDQLNSNNPNPIIRLFGDCSIDATLKNEIGQGNSIRLKADRENYIKVQPTGYKEDGTYIGAHTAIYSGLYPNHEVMIFQGNAHWGKIYTTQGILSMHGNGVYYGWNGTTNDTRLATTSEVNNVSGVANNALSNASNAYNLANSAYDLANGKLSQYSSSYITTGSHDPYSSDSYNLGYSGARWNQCSAKYGYFTNTYSLAIDNPVSTINDISLDNVIDDVIIESPNIITMSDEMNGKLVINVNALKENKNGHLFVSEDDGGRVVINESSLLALALQEIKKLKEKVKKTEKLESKVLKLTEDISNLTEVINTLTYKIE